MSFMDSGAGQSMVADCAAFLSSSLQSCYIMIEGVAGDAVVTTCGTADLFVQDGDGIGFILRMANSLMNPGQHTLLSLSQFQARPEVTVTLTNSSPTITHTDVNDRATVIPLVLDNGTFMLPYLCLSSTDPRRLCATVLEMTPTGPYEPPTLTFPDGRPRWKATVAGCIPIAYASHRFCVPLRALSGFRERVAALSDTVFVDSTTRPRARRTYETTSVSAMEDLSTRFMGTSTGRLSHTLDVSLGLHVAGRQGVVRPNRFPQGTMERRNTPIVSKSIVHHLHEASIAKCVYTDTFETDDVAYRYGQAFVCYKSRFGMVFPLQSRKEIPTSFLRFCADFFTPLILIRDNISENTGGQMEAACLQVNCQSGFSTPYTQQQDLAEGFIGNVCRLASFAMVYSGASFFLWRYAILAACFVYNITAGWYSQEQLWATPYELIYGEPFPDSSIVVPFGCAALVLLPKRKRGKFTSRCALVVYVHYVTHHPTYTYAF